MTPQSSGRGLQRLQAMHKVQADPSFALLSLLLPTLLARHQQCTPLSFAQARMTRTMPSICGLVELLRSMATMSRKLSLDSLPAMMACGAATVARRVSSSVGLTQLPRPHGPAQLAAQCTLLAYLPGMSPQMLPSCPPGTLALGLVSQARQMPAQKGTNTLANH